MLSLSLLGLLMGRILVILSASGKVLVLMIELIVCVIMMEVKWGISLIVLELESLKPQVPDDFIFVMISYISLMVASLN